jgi:hypothetical protein
MKKIFLIRARRAAPRARVTLVYAIINMALNYGGRRRCKALAIRS